MNSKIGGQAVIEGVMMRNGSEYAVSVRKPDGEIETKVEKAGKERTGILKAPIIRGVVAFIDSLVIGIKTLTYSASFFEEEEETPKKENKESNDKLLIGGTVALSVVLGVGIFMILPWFISSIIGKYIDNDYLVAVIEGLLRLIIFIAYVVAISQMNDIKRVFMYHGAEHKSINCVENGLDLTVENVRKQSRCHKRCGTSFLFFVIFISIIVFMFIRVENHLLQMGLRLLLVPVIAGISYEIIRFFGNSENKLAVALSKPGFAFQHLTTREPDDEMIEVAIASVEAVFDWQPFVEKVRRENIKKTAPGGSKQAEETKKSKAQDVKAKEAAEKKAKAEAEKKAKAEAEKKALEAKKAKEAEEQAKAAAAAEAERLAAEAKEAEEQAKAAAAAEAERLAAEAKEAEEQAKAAAAAEAERLAAEAKEAEEQAKAAAEQTKEAVEEVAEAVEEAETQVSARVSKDGSLSSLDKVLFVKKDTAPAKEFIDPLASKKVKRPEVVEDADDEDDDVLKALDKFFEFKDKND